MAHSAVATVRSVTQTQSHNRRFLRAISRMQRPGNIAMRETRMRAKMIVNSIAAKTF